MTSVPTETGAGAAPAKAPSELPALECVASGRIVVTAGDTCAPSLHRGLCTQSALTWGLNGSPSWGPRRVPTPPGCPHRDPWRSAWPRLWRILGGCGFRFCPRETTGTRFCLDTYNSFQTVCSLVFTENISSNYCNIVSVGNQRFPEMGKKKVRLSAEHDLLRCFLRLKLLTNTFLLALSSNPAPARFLRAALW